ncbi:IDEAL domain-containing protein [Paenibacillus sp. FA6]|uniref:IDEAL domain-containing protein n=1 Tax=Paenibacillus sp. FA6 TaxID=3413029 RepID=UPI003F656951
MSIEIGDWVKGNTNQGELIHGFIDSINLLAGTMGIHVIASDHETVIGTTIDVRNQGVKKLQESSLDNSEQLKNLIDIALLAKDEQWFMELTDQLNSIHHASNSHIEDYLITDMKSNRLGIL